MRDIASKQDCRALVEAFYGRARADALLGPIFAARLDGAWPQHLSKMADFWAAVVLGIPGFEGRPIERHMGLGIEGAHFERWLALWTATVDEGWSGPHAEQAKQSARRIAARLSAALLTPAPRSLSSRVVPA